MNPTGRLGRWAMALLVAALLVAPPMAIAQGNGTAGNDDAATAADGNSSAAPTVHVRFDDEVNDINTGDGQPHLDIQFMEALLDGDNVTMYMHLGAVPPPHSELEPGAKIVYTLVLQAYAFGANRSQQPQWTHFATCSYEGVYQTNCTVSVTRSKSLADDVIVTWQANPPRLDVSFPAGANMTLGDVGGLAMSTGRDGSSPTGMDATTNFLAQIPDFERAQNSRDNAGERPWWKSPGFIAGVGLGVYILLTVIERLTGKGKKGKGGKQAPDADGGGGDDQLPGPPN